MTLSVAQCRNMRGNAWNRENHFGSGFSARIRLNRASAALFVLRPRCSYQPDSHRSNSARLLSPALFQMSVFLIRFPVTLNTSLMYA